MLRRAYGLENPPVSEQARLDLRAATDEIIATDVAAVRQNLVMLVDKGQVNPLTMNMSIAENFIRSANAPRISAGVITANMHWKIAKVE